MENTNFSLSAVRGLQEVSVAADAGREEDASRILQRARAASDDDERTLAAPLRRHKARAFALHGHAYAHCSLAPCLARLCQCDRRLLALLLDRLALLLLLPLLLQYRL